MTLNSMRTATRLGLLAAALVVIVWQRASAHPVPSPCHDFVTGGGFFFGSSAGPDRVNFGGNAGFKGPNQTAPSGHWNLVDHNNQLHFSTLTIDTYNGFNCFCAEDQPGGGPCSDRVFTGTGRVKVGRLETDVSYTIEVIDTGEPGNKPKGADRFIASLSNGYHADSGGCPLDGIDGGNIQIHKPCDGVNPK
jgi:hypothetical protein